MKSNPIIYLVASLLVGGAAVVGFFGGGDEEDAPAAATAPPTAAASGTEDTPGEEVRAVGASIGEVQTKTREVEQRVDALAQQIGQVNGQLEQQSQRFDKIESLLGALNENVTSDQGAPNLPTSSALDAAAVIGELPNLGIAGNLTLEQDAVAPPDPKQIVWTKPAVTMATLAATPAAPTPAAARQAGDAPPAKRQRRTVPAASQFSGKLLTGLVGRIPRRGRIQDPWPFKIVTTERGLGPNGARLSLAGMIWEGEAVGDASLNCVRGRVLRLSAVLPDGSIASVRGQNADGRIAWISDRSGRPCLSGELVSNVGRALLKRGAAGLLAGGASALADAERTRTTSADGNTVENVTGDALRAAVGDAVAESAGSIQEYIDAQEGDIWDAIVVPAGGEVVIHVSDEIVFEHTPAKGVFDAHALSQGHNTKRLPELP